MEKIIIRYHDVFLKHARKYPDQRNAINEAISTFSKNPFDPKLKTHKLTGKLTNYWSFSVDYHLRLIFRFTKANEAFFLDIGTHEIYR